VWDNNVWDIIVWDSIMWGSIVWGSVVCDSILWHRIFPLVLGGYLNFWDSAFPFVR